MKIEVVVLVGLYDIWEGGVRWPVRWVGRLVVPSEQRVLHAVRRVLEACSGVYGTGR